MLYYDDTIYDFRQYKYTKYKRAYNDSMQIPKCIYAIHNSYCIHVNIAFSQSNSLTHQQTKLPTSSLGNKKSYQQPLQQLPGVLYTLLINFKRQSCTLTDKNTLETYVI